MRYRRRRAERAGANRRAARTRIDGSRSRGSGRHPRRCP
ncbi:hypothetical protein BURPS1655_F0092 [Burkholderia pseudomallei 1655]|nr:ABC transporter permease [Burkholderia pseudomallei]EDU11496.1 hypothetical protein BURPS1655_F0092 [Burkholderia pseudomallei 1655]